MKTPDARKLIGKLVEWEDARSAFIDTKKRGVVLEVANKNVHIGNDWYWLPDIKELRIVEDKP